MGDSPRIKIGIIGGTGFDTHILKDATETSVTTPYGDPSDVLLEGKIHGIPCVVLPRHAKGHSIMPGKINYRANIWALKQVGCTHLLVTTATGSLREEIKPGHFVVPHDFIDRTQGRKQTFFDGENDHCKGVCHIPMYPAFSEPMRALLIKTMTDDLGYKERLHTKGVIVCIEGPRFSSQAESLMYRTMGGDIINMTTVPEVVLAKEAGLLYGAVALATDYDCWRESESSVTVDEVRKLFAKCQAEVTKIISTVIKNMEEIDWSMHISEAEAVVTTSKMN